MMADFPPAFDWQAAYGRLERIRQRLAQNGILDPDVIQQRLQHRARLLAQLRQDAPPLTTLQELLIFTLAQAYYGVSTDHTLEVLPRRQLTPVPGTPPFMCGILNHRGHVLPVLHLLRLFDLPEPDDSMTHHIVVVHIANMTFGLLATTIVGVTRLGAHEIVPITTVHSPAHQGIASDVMGEMVAVLDLEALARHPRLIINDEPL